MQDRWFKAGAVMICLAMSLGWSTPVFATTYNIYPDSTDCSLDDALKAINTQQSLIKDGSGGTIWVAEPTDSDEVICAAGTGSDIINLASCQTDNTTPLEHGLKYCVDPDTKETLPPQDAATYVLTGQMVLGDDKTANVTIGLIRDVFDKSIYPNAIIQAPANQRALFLYSGSSVTLKSITLQGSDISGNTDPVTDATQADFGKAGPNGGVVYAKGGVTLSEGSRLTGGTAANGGGIYLDAGTGSLSLSLTNAFINDNTATANGGGVGTSATGSVIITGGQFNVFDNVAAKGGGIYLDGEGASLSLASGTLYGNTAAEGSAIDLVAGFAPGSTRASLLNNLTITGNTGSAALHYSDFCQQEDSTTTPSTCAAYGPPRSQVLYAGVTDSIQPVAASTTVWLDVVKNDLSSSATIDCSAMPNCMTFETTPAGSATVVYASERLGGASDDSTFITATDPGTVATPDATHTYPLVEYTPAVSFPTDKSDQFIYRVTKDVLTTDGSTPSSVDLRAQVNLAVDAASLATDDAPGEYTPDSTMRRDFLYNSVVVNNAGGGCSMTFDASNTTSSLSQYLENAYSITADGGAGSTVGAGTGCPAAEQVMSPDILGNWDNSTPAGRADNADADVLSGGKPNGAGGTDTCTLTDAACEPLDFGAQYYHLQGFMPTDELRLPANDPTLLNAGSPDSTTSGWVCASTDQRGHTRADRCDAGAVELGIAAGATDNLDNVTTSQMTWLDVVKNDLGDEAIDCTRITTPCLNFPLQSRYGSTLTVVYAAGPLADKVDGTQVFTTATNPGVVAVADATHTYPLIQYVSAAGFHGQDQFMYEIPLDVLSGPTLAGVVPRAQVNLSVAPVDDFPSKDISDFKSGGVGVWMLLGLLLLGLVRTVTQGRGAMKKNSGLGRLLLVSALLVSAGVSQADITVNDLGDPTDLTAAANDGKCTLREALQRSFDVNPEPNTDCDPGAPGTDTIILPDGTITLSGPLDISVSNSVVLQGQGVDKTIIDGNSQYRISTSSALSLQYLTFQHGSAVQGGAIFTISSLVLDHVALLDNTATQNGGAIFLSYGGDTVHTLSVDSSYIARNTAPSGGAVGTVGQSQQLAISIANSTFDSNSATGTCTACKGGALDLNLAKNGNLAVTNSIFTNNSTTAGASAIDLSNANASVSANLLNNTFYNNTGGAFLDSGANTNVILSNSIVAGADIIGCASAGGKLKGDYYNLYSDAEPSSCGASSTAVIAPMADISAALSGGTLQASTGSTTDYLPPLFWTTSVTPEIIIDKGNPDGLSSGVVSPSTCRTTDMRGKSRNAGSACDIGAYEWQSMTAQDDAVSTLTARSDGRLLTDREARADVLKNDLPGEGAGGAYTITTDQIGFLVCNSSSRPCPTINQKVWRLSPADHTKVELTDIVEGDYTVANDDGVSTTLQLPGLTSDGTTVITGVTGTLNWLEMANGDPACDPGDDCGLRFKMTCEDLAVATGFSTCDALKAAIQSDVDNGLTHDDAGAAINATNDPHNLVCPNSTTPAIKVPYVAYDSNNNINNAFLAITLSNVPPQFVSSTITVHTKPDEAVTFPLNVSDADGVIASVGIADNGDPLFAAEDPALVEQKKQTGDIGIHPAWGTGIKLSGDTTNPQITYIRANKTQVFNDTFKLQVKDNCGGSSTVTVKVLFPQEGEGGALLSGGGLGWGLALLACLGLIRRRRLCRA